MSEDTVEQALAMLAAPRGAGSGADAARSAALDALLANPGIAHPRLLAMAEGRHPPPLILLALAAFGRPESIPVLTAALRNGDAPTAATAADALARHPLPEAREALEAALQGTAPQVVVAAASGLAERGEAVASPALRAALAASSDEAERVALASAIEVLQHP